MFFRSLLNFKLIMDEVMNLYVFVNKALATKHVPYLRTMICIVNMVWILKIYVVYEFSIYFTCKKAKAKDE